MNKSRTLDLRYMFNAQLPFAVGDSRNRAVWRRLKKAYQTIPAVDRDPDRFSDALAKAIARASSLTQP